MAAAAIAVAARMRMKAAEEPEKTDEELMDLAQENGVENENNLPSYRDPDNFGILKPYIQFSKILWPIFGRPLQVNVFYNAMPSYFTNIYIILFNGAHL